ncbi:MAG: hypothetical protein RL208_543 [Pseudomonadota bacterium]|jgi:type IV secretory pathway VirB2 component (pilin)
MQNIYKNCDDGFYCYFILVILFIFYCNSCVAYQFVQVGDNINAEDCTNSGDCPEGKSCITIDSASDFRKQVEGNKIQVIEAKSICIDNESGITPCLNDSDCFGIIGADRCLTSLTNQTLLKFDGKHYGVCGVYNSNSERNVFVQIICVVIKLITGAAGRGLVAVVIISISVMFFIGKVSWNMMLSAALGAGMLFGAPSLVKIFSGKGLVCY